jgi:hypothetical protein
MCVKGAKGVLLPHRCGDERHVTFEYISTKLRIQKIDF